METGGDLTATQAKTVLADLVDSGGDPASLAASHGFEAMGTSELEGLVDGLIAEHPDDWEVFVGGDEGERKKKSGFFVGQIMKATRGQADGRVVNEILERRAGNA
jgi:aspartyl-tRNA(Asn)/glutamyl-tRNA(Gln) amidotransferase subunit B